MALEGIRLTAPPFRGGKIVSPLLFQGGGTTQALIGLDSGNKLKIIRGSDVAGASGITIDTSGKVGIGTTAPVRTLHVSGSGAIIGSNVDNTLILRDTRAGTNWNYLEWHFSDGRRDWVLGRGGNGNFVLWNDLTGNVIARVEQGAPAEALVIKSSGNVGIGTTAPETRLDVVGIVQPRRVGDADSANTLKNSFPLQLQGAYWNGAASVKRHGQVLLQMISVSPQARIAFQVEGVDLGGLDEAIADGETALLLRRNVGGTFSLVRVSMGAPDSGGTGYRLLRVPN